MSSEAHKGVGSPETAENMPENLPRGNAFCIAGCEQILRLCAQRKTNADGAVVAIEVLIRPLVGGGSPECLIQKAEADGTIHELTLEVLRRTCVQVAFLAEHGVQTPVAVNVAPAELTDMFVAEVEQILREEHVDATMIDLEITERQPIEKKHIDTLRALRKLGVGIVIDDFGAGHATMDTLVQLREYGDLVKTVKIDKTLVELGKADETAKMLVEQGYDVVVEGVETEKERASLPDNVMVQGFVDGGVVSFSSLVREMVHTRSTL